jgi:hypothetical protein
VKIFDGSLPVEFEVPESKIQVWEGADGEAVISLHPKGDFGMTRARVLGTVLGASPWPPKVGEKVSFYYWPTGGVQPETGWVGPVLSIKEVFGS